MAKGSVGKVVAEGAHSFDFHVSGPRNVSSHTWKEILCSYWKDCNYRRIVMACLVQAAYLLELDRQENRIEESGLAPKWWKPFRYKLSQKLVDERDGSIFGALFEWDRSAALSDFILIRPSGAPAAILALRGTLLWNQTLRRDLEDDLRYLAWESLKGSVRFNVALESLKAAVQRHGSSNVCVVGHSLGAGFALQVGKELAKQGVHVEAHLFNPPSVSLAMSMRSIGEKAGIVWKRIRSTFPYGNGNAVYQNTDGENVLDHGGELVRTEVKRWIPHLYVNSSDYICSYYTQPARAVKGDMNLHNSRAAKGDTNPHNSSGKTKNVLQELAVAKLFVSTKGPQKFLEAHGLAQWWADDMELQQAIENSKLIYRQLKSLYSPAAPMQKMSL